MTTVKQETNYLAAMVGQEAREREKEAVVRSLCGESEILRNRLLSTVNSGTSCGGGHSSLSSEVRYSSIEENIKVTRVPTPATATVTFESPAPPSTSTTTNSVAGKSVIMSSSSGGGSSSSGTSYPKCNISLSMGGRSEQLSVITTTSVSGNLDSSRNIYPARSDQQHLQQHQSTVGGANLPEIDIKPNLTVGKCAPPVTTLPMTSGPQTTTSSFHHSITTTIKAEPGPAPGSVEIPYDRERILNFLTDYWKSKNLQQVAEAQQQTAGVSGVSSADFCPAPQRIVEEALFDLFVEHPMMIDGLAIPKRAWAKAFYEKDIIQTSKVLFEALFSEQEMQQCTLNGKKGTPELSAVKMLAILRASSWMKNKKQDPYSFNTDIPSHNQFPTNEEREKIEKKVFTERRSQANRKITKTNTGESSSPPHSHESSASELPNQGSPAGQGPSSIPAPAGENRLSLSDDLRREHMAPLAKIPRLDLDTEVIKQLQMLYAQNPEGLISYLLPDARAILVDGFLIPHDDWTKAFGEVGVDIVKAAWTLFKVLFSKTEILNCTLNGKNGTRELCPVKKLAILRVVSWMKEIKDQGAPVDIFKFNVRRPECNCFPSDEDKDKIETKVYTEKRYQACRKLKGQQV